MKLTRSSRGRVRSFLSGVCLFVMVWTLPMRAQTPSVLMDLTPSMTCANAGSGVYDCRSNTVYLHNSLGGQYAMTGVTSPILFSPTSQVNLPWVQLPQSVVALGPLSGLVTSNTTIKIRLIANTAVPQSGASYTALLSMAASSGRGEMFVIGQHGPDWTFGRLTDFPGSTTAYWLTPWEPIDLYPQTQGVEETIYYTFKPNGRLQIDMFTPYIDPGQNTAVLYDYIWEESIEDGGWPLSNMGGESKNGGSLPFLQPGELYLGKANSTYFGKNDPSTIPQVSPDKIMEIKIFSAAMSNEQILADTNVDYPSDSLNAPTDGSQLYPCNTGRWLEYEKPLPVLTTVHTPCGSQPSGTPIMANANAIPATIMPVGSGGPLTPLNLQADTSVPGQVTLRWTPPYGGPISNFSYAVSIHSTDGQGQSMTTNSTSAVFSSLLGSTITSFQAWVEALPSGQPAGGYAFTNFKVQMVPASPTHPTATAGPGSITANWEPPVNLGNPAMTGYIVMLKDTSANSASVLQTVTTFNSYWIFSNLNPHANYQVSVQATSSVGNSTPATTQAITPSVPIWTQCATEGTTCTAPAGSVIRFGPNAAGDGTGGMYYVTIPSSGSILCDTSVLGDPTPGTVKVCAYAASSQLPAAPAGYVFCGYEGDTCYYPAANAAIVFGFIYPTSSSTTPGISSPISSNPYSLSYPETLECSTANWNDPAPDFRKACFISMANVILPITGASLSPSPGGLVVSWNAQNPSATFGIALFNNGKIYLTATAPTNSYTFNGLDPKASYQAVVVQNGSTVPGSQTGVAKPQPVGWGGDTPENGTFSQSPTSNFYVQFGTGTFFTYAPGVQSTDVQTTLMNNAVIPCTIAVFGDPFSGQTKTCKIAPFNQLPTYNGNMAGTSPATAFFCGYEDDTCYVPGPATVVMGLNTNTTANGKWISFNLNAAFTIHCTVGHSPVPDTDPAPDQRKMCFYFPNPSSAPSNEVGVTVALMWRTKDLLMLSWNPPDAGSAYSLTWYKYKITASCLGFDPTWHDTWFALYSERQYSCQWENDVFGSNNWAVTMQNQAGNGPTATSYYRLWY